MLNVLISVTKDSLRTSICNELAKDKELKISIFSYRTMGAMIQTVEQNAAVLIIDTLFVWKRDVTLFEYLALNNLLSHFSAIILVYNAPITLSAGILCSNEISILDEISAPDEFHNAIKNAMQRFSMFKHITEPFLQNIVGRHQAITSFNSMEKFTLKKPNSQSEWNTLLCELGFNCTYKGTEYLSYVCDFMSQNTSTHNTLGTAYQAIGTLLQIPTRTVESNITKAVQRFNVTSNKSLLYKYCKGYDGSDITAKWIVKKII